jgi:hypothetical protein
LNIVLEFVECTSKSSSELIFRALWIANPRGDPGPIRKGDEAHEVLSSVIHVTI